MSAHKLRRCASYAISTLTHAAAFCGGVQVGYALAWWTRPVRDDGC